MQTSKVIDSLRFPMAVLVVLIHSYMTGVGLVGKLLYDVITRVAVPTFFLISGFLFYKRLEQWKWDVWKIKVKKRVWTLVVPYFVWISLRVVWDRMMEIIIQMHKGG